MQFLILGFDGTDEGALDRRLAARDAHIKQGDELVANGTFWYGAALRDDEGKMIGSCMVLDFPSREALDEHLKTEPYILGDVWKEIEIHKCSVREPWQFNRPKEFYDDRDTGN